MRRFLFFLLCLPALYATAGNPISGLLERIDKGASRKFKVELVKGDNDFFELDQKGYRVVVRGNNYVSVAAGVNWYLKYHAGIHLSWNNMHASLPQVLPPVKQRERHATDISLRYYLNYCTYSYSMPFWDWQRWEQEIDWMALHGVNLPLCIVGTGSVWRNVLLRLGYNKKEVNDFVAGPAFQAWWLMNNLQGWGGPNPDSWYSSQERLQKQILRRMREFGLHPVLPGYSGMLPADAATKLGLKVADPGRWNDYRRPAFLQPEDKNFGRIARIYYEELTKLYGKADYYSMDPFHEGGNTAGVNLSAAGRSIWQSMKAANPRAVWVAQAWGACPYDEMIKGLPAGDMLILDLYSENRPQWGDPSSSWYRQNGFRQHNWAYCMLLNFGGNVGLFGKMRHVSEEYYKARNSEYGKTLKGVGLTMEGIENNAVMYELVSELPWRSQPMPCDEWLRGYVRARYGKSLPQVDEAWLQLANTIYNCPDASTQQGTHESVFCARPSQNVYQVSTWSEMSDYYSPMDVIKAAGGMVAVADSFRGNNNYEYDLVDIVRQAVAEKGRLLYPVVMAAYKAGDRQLFDAAANRFMHLIELQDSLLATRSEFRLGTWTERARQMGNSDDEKRLYEWNACVQITTWGNRQAADNGGLHDYAHKEWQGLLRDFYLMRWRVFFDDLCRRMRGENPQNIDYYALEEAWVNRHPQYTSAPEGDAIDVAKAVYRDITDQQSDIVIPNEQQRQWADAEIGVLIHFEMPVFNPEYNWRKWGSHPDASDFNPTELNTDQWIETAAKLGAKYAVLVAKHCSGFSLWPTNAHDYSVKNSPWKGGKGDVVADFVASCRKYGLKPGIYASTTANGYLYVDNPGMVQSGSPVTQQQYNEIVKTQLTELWSNYGELVEIWFDGGVLAKDKGGADILPLVQRLQPNAIAFQGPYGHPNLIRWVGNEEGVAPYPCWATADSTTNASGTKVINGLHGNASAPYWCPGEADFTLRWNKSFQGGWFWHANQDDMMFSVDELMRKYETSVGRNTCMLLGMVVDSRGLVPDADVERITALGKAITAKYGHPMAETSGAGSMLTLTLDKPMVIDHLVIQEDIAYGERILEYEVQSLIDGKWQRVCVGTNVGHKRIETFAPVTTDRLRLVVKKSKAEPRIKCFSAFSPVRL